MVDKSFLASILVEPNNPCWLIERRSSAKKPWELSVAFPMRLTQSTIEFYLAEERRIESTSNEYEGLRIAFFDGIRRYDIAGIVLAPKAPTKFQRRKGRRAYRVAIWRPSDPRKVRP